MKATLPISRIVFRSFWGILFIVAMMVGTNAVYGQHAGTSQQLAISKVLKPGIQAVGILSSSIDDKSIEDWTRAGLAMGVKIYVGKPKTAREIAGFYNTLVKEKKVQVIIIPDASDELMTGIGFEYLRESALADRVGVFVPQESMLAKGALCFVTTSGGKIKVYINQRIAQVIGATIPSDPSADRYVVR